MNKPQKNIFNIEGYDYSEVIEYIEEKYNIDTNDFLGKSKHFDKWLDLFNEEPPNYPISPNNNYKVKIGDKLVKITKEEYNERFSIIHAQYKRYEEWEKINPAPPSLSFWDWLMDNDFMDIHNGCNASLSVKTWMNKLDKDDWKYKILKYIHDEFKEDVMDFWIEW